MVTERSDTGELFGHTRIAAILPFRLSIFLRELTGLYQHKCISIFVCVHPASSSFGHCSYIVERVVKKYPLPINQI
jgi:hypothetical protein